MYFAITAWGIILRMIESNLTGFIKAETACVCCDAQGSAQVCLCRAECSGFTNTDLWDCFCGFVFFFFPVLKDESKKHNAESTHNKGGLLNTASGTTLYSMTVTAKALSPHCWVSGRIVSVWKTKTHRQHTCTLWYAQLLDSTTSDFSPPDTN